MNVITNAQPRRLSMAYFTGLFLLAVAIPCVAFIKSVNLGNTLPAKALLEIKEKERIIKLVADLSDTLRLYQTAQIAKSPDATKLNANCRDMIANLYSTLRNKDTSHVYLNINKCVQIGDQYFQAIQRSNLEKGVIDPAIAQLQAEKLALMNEIQVLRIQLASKPAAAPAPVAHGGGEKIVYVKQECPPQTTAAGTPCPPVADCQAKVTEYKQKVGPSLELMSRSISGIRKELSRIKCWLVCNSTAEKKSIEDNLKELESTLMKVQSQ